MLAAVLTVALLFGSVFADPVSCVVQGYVFRMTERDPVVFSRADLCEGVRVESAGPTLVLHSPSHWVAVIVPPDHGQRRFMYRWQSGLAHIGAETVPIEWGDVERG